MAYPQRAITFNPFLIYSCLGTTKSFPKRIYKSDPGVRKVDRGEPIQPHIPLPDQGLPLPYLAKAKIIYPTPK